MFIKIKAQSSDLEKEYIRERNIFKKKRKGPKLFLSGLLIAAIAGYFYYLNTDSGVPGTPSIADSNQESVPLPTTIKESPSIAESEIDSQATEQISEEPQLITDAVADDEPESDELTQTIEPQEVNSDLSDETVLLAENIRESEYDQNFDELADQTEEPSEILDNSENPLQQQATSNELTLEEQTEDAGVIDTDSIITTAETEVTNQEQLTVTDPEVENVISTDSAEPENSAEIAVIEDEPDQNVVPETLTAASSSSIEDDSATVVEKEILEAEDEIVEESDLTSETDLIAAQEQEEEIKLTSATALDAENTPELTDAVSIVDEELKQELDTAESQTTEAYDEADISEVSDATIPPVAEQPAEISDESLTTSVTNSDEQTKSSPIKTISNMISNVFAKTGEEQELVADVVEIDFSKVTNPEEGQQKIAIVTVTDSNEPEYEGSSVEALNEPDYQPINTEAVEITTFEISENDVNEIISQQELTDNQSSTIAEGNASIFEGVDSISSSDIPVATTEPEEQPQTDDKVIEVEEVEPVEVAKTEVEQSVVEKATVPESSDLATTTNPTPAVNKSTITIKELYDQLMADLDENPAPTDVASSAAKQNSTDKITIKQLYQQISQTDNSAQPTETEKTQPTTSEGTEADQPISTVEIKVDPDRSLAMADEPDTQREFGAVEELVITSNANDEPSQSPSPVVEQAPVQVTSINTQALTDNKGSTPLMIAALNSDNQVVRELIQQGARVNARNDWGWTALLNATIRGNQSMVEYLLKNGASPHLVDNDGRSPLMAAVLNSHPQIVKTLLRHNADVNKANRDGWTALSFAAWKGDVASVKYLLEANAFKQHRTAEGLTPLQLAQQGDHTEVINLLNQ